MCLGEKGILTTEVCHQTVKVLGMMLKHTYALMCKESCSSSSSSEASLCMSYVFLCCHAAAQVDRFCFKLRKISAETHKVFKNVYGDETPSHTHVLEWFKRFRVGHDRKDDQGMGGHYLLNSGL
jgi:hypothetical protein